MTDTVTRSAPPLRSAFARVWRRATVATFRDPALLVSTDYWRALFWIAVFTVVSPFVVLYSRGSRD